MGMVSRFLFVGFLTLCFNISAQNKGIILGLNCQNHLTKFESNQALVNEVNKNLTYSPVLGYYYKTKNEKFSFESKLFYIRYNKTYTTDLNFNHRGLYYDQVTTNNKERFPCFVFLCNYEIKKIKDISILSNIGLIYSASISELSVLSQYTTLDKSIIANYSTISSRGQRVNPKLGLGLSYKINKLHSIGLDCSFVFGSKNYFFKEEWKLEDTNGNLRYAAYGLNGKSTVIELKFIKLFNKPK